MKKKDLELDLFNNGFKCGDNGKIIGHFDCVDLQIIITANLFGNITMVSIYYNFRQELPNDNGEHEDVWDKVEAAIDSIDLPCLMLGSLGYEYVEASIMHCALKTLDASKLKEYCMRFHQAIQPIMNEYGL